ncbi:hypothetical protein NC796_22565 [Aliifodinibius sp. S!AR15-10]|nr:hypothetical protein [Aliifodinibius sp. S!AR15-10]
MKILALFLVLFTPLGMSGQGDNQPVYDTAEILPVKAESTTSTHPLGGAALFTLHHQAESGINTSNTLSIPNVLHDADDDKHAIDAIEALSQRHASTYLSVSRTIEHGFTVKNLIFPFHFFL